MSFRSDRREVRADNKEKRWTDREVLALLRAATAPDFVHDRVHDMMRQRRLNEKAGN